MRKAVLTARIALVILAVMVLGLALSCGGGRRTASLLPGVSGDTHSTAGGGDRTASVPIGDIGKLDPRVQELYADPGWEGPVTPQALVEAPPAPPELTIERILSENANIERLDRQAEPVVDSKGASYPFVPPSDPDYFPMAGEYDPLVYPGTPPLANPPYGSDEASDGDRLEDRLQRVNQFNKIARSFVLRGITITNQFNSGYSADSSLAAIYQSYRDVGGKWGEWSYPASQTYVTVPSAALTVDGNVFSKLQFATKVKRFSQVENFAWYDILIAPTGALGSPVLAPNTPNETYASVQEFFFDTTKSIHGAEAWMVALTSSEADKIDELIGKQITDGPVATFPVFGTIFKRWADDVYNVGVDEPYTGRLGWPLGDPFVDRNGRYLTGPNGQYLRYGQYFEKGYMWWNDYVLPTVPDEVFIYMYDKDNTLITGGTYTQDPTVVKYGTGGPLGVVAFANPIIANVGDPVYFKAFPYGGPTTNVNGFADDWFLWNFRDGTVSAASQQYPIHEYYTEAVFTPRLMFTLDVDGDGNPDGNTTGYKIFADTPAITIGHLGDGGGGGGGGDPTILIVQDNTSTTGTDSLAHVTAVQNDLDTIGISNNYETVTTSQVTSAAVLAPYLCVIWCPPKGTQSYDWYDVQIDATERTIIMSYVQGGGNLILPTTGLYNNYDGYPTWHQFMDAAWSSAYTSGVTYNTVTSAINYGPGGSVTMINRDNIFQCLGYTMGMPNVTTLLEYSGSRTGVARDHVPSSVGGMFVAIATHWHKFTTSTPAAAGRSGLLWNLLNWIDPDILVPAGGSGGGDDPINPYDGPVDIADVFAWVYASDGSLISGGNGDDVAHRAAISVISTPKSINFDCLARSSSGIDLIYQWEFMPSGGFSTWTKYTSYAYTGGVDPDGGGPAVTGDPFPVNVRVYNSIYGSYASTPPDQRDIDSVLVQVAGALPVDITDNGTVIQSGYAKDPVTGNVTLDLLYRTSNGAVPYDSVWVDYDYNFVTFQNRVQVTPTPDEGAYSYTLTIPSPSYRSYYIAIRVYDADAPNAMDTYVWPSPVKVAAPVLLINDSVSTTCMDALKADLVTIGSGYNEKSASTVSATDFNGAMLVILHLQDHRYSYYPSNFTSTLKTLFTDYWDAGGNSIVMMDMESDYYMGGTFDNDWLVNYWDMDEYNYPYAYCYGYNGYWSEFFDNCPTYNGVANGPGGTVSNIYYGKSSYPQNRLYLYNGYYRIPSERLLIGNGNYTNYDYYNSWYLTTSGGGNNVIYGASWDDTNSSSMSGTGGRPGLLRNLIEIANPDLM